MKTLCSLYLNFSREENGRKRVKYLQKQLGDIKKEKEKEIQDRNEMIAHLKDQLQVGISVMVDDSLICPRSLSVKRYAMTWN